MHGRGACVGDYQAPLFFAWQLTNRCQSRCLHCCEESGPDKAWKDELSREEALAVTRQIVEAGIAEVAFGGGEPLIHPHVWEIFDILYKGRVAIKIETNGLLIGENEADRLAELEAETVQISVDGATAATHEKVRPGGSFDGAIASIERLVKRGIEPEFVFVPTRHNIAAARQAFQLAARLGCRKFITGPMMRLGRAAQDWCHMAPTPEAWKEFTTALTELAKQHPKTQFACYPWDIVEEIRRRATEPQAMVLMVPNGKVKLLNALPFSCGRLPTDGMAQVWMNYQTAWRHPDVRDFIARVPKEPALLVHANETWELGTPIRQRPSPGKGELKKSCV